MTQSTHLRRAAALTVALGVLAASARGDEPATAVFPGESKPTAARFAGVRKLIDAKKWPEAVEELQALLTTNGDDLVPLTPQRSVQCRRLCHFYLAGLPPEALKLYRDRADPQARKWLEQAAAARDERLLRRVADEAFCSRPGEQALDLLGDLAFERGDFAEAEHWRRLLLPPPAPAKADAPRDFALYYPDAQADPARTRAKILLDRLHLGVPSWEDELAAYRKDYGAAEGALAGGKGRYADLLRQAADDLKKAGATDAADWPTFGGDASRGRIAASPPRLLRRLGDLCRPSNERRFDLETRKPTDEDEPPPDRAAPASVRNRAMAFQPVFVDGKVFTADARYVTAYDPRTGAARPWYDVTKVNGGFTKDVGGVDLDLKLPAAPDLGYTLTAADGRLYGRFGLQAVREFLPPKDDKDRPQFPESLIASLGLGRPADDGNALWKPVQATAVEDADKGRGFTFFEGAPVVHDGLYCVAATRFENGRAVTQVRAYPADYEAPARWRQDVCETREFAEKDQRYRHHLLTLAGPYFIYCSHSGAVVALDALTGKRVWAVRYPSRGDKTEAGDPSPRGLAPALFADGRVYVAPADSDRLLCLDAVTGATLWSRDRIEAVHLLGVGAGRLIFTTPTGLRAVGAEDGLDAWALPDGGGALAPMGRGLLVGDLVLWPTENGVYAVRQSDGAQPEDPTLLRNIPPGNLLYAGGCLASAGRRTLTLFVPPALRLEEREGESKKEPESAAAALELGRAEADAGLTERALETFVRAERLAAGPPRRKALAAAARAGRHATLLAAAGRAAAARDWEEAEGFFGKAAAPEFPPALRLAALARAAETWRAAHRPVGAVAAWQAILSAEVLRGLPMRDDSGAPWAAAELAETRIAGLIEAYGAKAYEPFEKRAKELSDKAVGDKRAEMIERVAEEFPNAEATRRVLWWIGLVHRDAKRPGAASHALRRQLAVGKRREAIDALGFLADRYEAADCWEDARELWLRLARDYGDEDWMGGGGVVPFPIRKRVQDHFRQTPEFDRKPPPPPALLGRTWEANLPPDEVFVPTDDDPTGPADAPLLSGGAGRLTCRSAETGKVRWRADLPFAPAWAARRRDLIVAAGPGGAAAVNLADGRPEWVLPAPAPAPTFHEEDEAVDGATRAEPLTSYHLLAGRLILVQGDRRILSVDAEAGRVVWHRWVPGAGLRQPAPFGCFFHVCPLNADRLLVQTSGGRRWLLDAATGRRLDEQPTAAEPWPRTPTVVDERAVCVTPDDRTVLMLDASTGNEIWSYAVPGVTTRTGEAPQVAADPDALLIAEPTNLGWRLQRLDRATGKPVWDAPPLLNVLDPAVGDWALDADAAYGVQDGALFCRSLKDGKIVWEGPTDGPPGRWRVRRVGGLLLAHPAGARGAQFQFRWPFGALQWDVSRPPGFETGGFPVLLADTRTGRPVQRLNCAVAPRAVTRLNPLDGAFAPGFRLTAGGDEPPAVRVNGRGAVAVADGRAWGFAAK
jgi:outer membrane protein assembly factor BamB